jgi:hypothetical protein
MVTSLREDQQRKQLARLQHERRKKMHKDINYNAIRDPDAGPFQAYKKSREDLAAVWENYKGKETSRRTSFTLGGTQRLDDKSVLFELKRTKQREMAREKLKHRIVETGSLEKVFAMFDKDGDGSISPTEFKRGLALLGIGLLLEDSSAMIEHIDKNGDKRITIEELRSFLVKY